MNHPTRQVEASGAFARLRTIRTTPALRKPHRLRQPLIAQTACSYRPFGKHPRARSVVRTLDSTHCSHCSPSLRAQRPPASPVLPSFVAKATERARPRTPAQKRRSSCLRSQQPSARAKGKDVRRVNDLYRSGPRVAVVVLEAEPDLHPAEGQEEDAEEDVSEVVPGPEGAGRSEV